MILPTHRYTHTYKPFLHAQLFIYFYIFIHFEFIQHHVTCLQIKLFEYINIYFLFKVVKLIVNLLIL